MGEASRAELRLSTAKRGNGLHQSAACRPGMHARVARAIWADKTAEHWAAAAGVQVRMAKYWLSGRVSDTAKIALAREILA